ncbi:R3H domain-containing nucleic acid-binding protein [Pseudolysinimonas sp.]|uniref:Jag family protein n=1 Tax=Pseudolysinimonas sp. TaxID=2680009 RepID=UPI00286AC930|nr:R3H domain-containing nucleic acid-binding protein [Pseudolysinimonas sp.]
MTDTTETPTIDEADGPIDGEELVPPAAELAEHGEPSEQAEPSEQDVIDEGDAAADYIEELLDIADIDGDIDIDARGGRAYLTVSSTDGSNLRLLSKPDTVTAIQELTRLAVQNRTGRFSRLILDIGGSRDARAGELAALVDHAVSRLEGGAATASLPPMSSYERKLVHDIVAERGYTSESEGEGRDRHTVIKARAGA